MGRFGERIPGSPVWTNSVAQESAIDSRQGCGFGEAALSRVPGRRVANFDRVAHRATARKLRPGGTRPRSNPNAINRVLWQFVGQDAVARDVPEKRGDCSYLPALASPAARTAGNGSGHRMAGSEHHNIGCTTARSTFWQRVSSPNSLTRTPFRKHRIAGLSRPSRSGTY